MPPPLLLTAALAAATASSTAHAAACSAESGPQRTPVIELYTSEGCSSCPPADRWISTLKPVAASGKAVVQAFHVGYWDYIGWVDRFAAPAHTQRQRQLAAWNRLPNIYTPQLVRNGRDWRGPGDFAGAAEAAGAGIRLAFEAGLVQAQVTPMRQGAWAAYWTVTEHGHRSKVTAGENAGEQLQHDFVVRQYVPAGQYRGAQSLKLHPVPATAGHERQVNLVVYEPGSGETLQALSLACAG